MLRAWTLAMVSLAFAGCASVANNTLHPMRIETLNDSGAPVAGADCKLTNDYGVTRASSGDTVQVRRSSADLDIVCTHPDNPDALGRAISRANAGMFGNILLGGGIGALIDHKQGTAYTYPTWIQLVYGKSLVFDRTVEKDGQPTPSAEAVAAKQ
jgi:hypothetical protein